MLLRRITEHVKAQNWFAVALDFLIVVTGVFIGIQVSNWNEARAFDATNEKIRAFKDVGAAGERSLAFLGGGADCGDDCWSVIVDFLHASQWQGARLGLSAYAEMRRLGLPRSRPIADAVAAYYAQNETLSASIGEMPEYRNLVRGLVPVDFQRKYWANCWRMIDGKETLLRRCEAHVANDDAAAAIAVIAGYPRILESLTQWTGFILATPQPLGDQNRAGERAIVAISAKLGD